MMVGLQAWKLGFFLLINYQSEDYKFRRIMLGLFLGVFTLGKIFELVQVSAYHDSHIEAVMAFVAVLVVYCLNRFFINETKSAVGTRRCLYWAFVGDLVKDFSSTR
jgi:hypothetical protein